MPSSPTATASTPRPCPPWPAASTSRSPASTPTSPAPRTCATGIAALALNELADLVAEALAGRSGKDALVACADCYRDYARAHPGRYAATRIPLAADSPAVAAGRRHAELTRSVLRGYRIDETDTVHAVRLLGSVFHGFAELERGGGFAHSAPSSDESWTRILDVLDATLRDWPVA